MDQDGQHDDEYIAKSIQDWFGSHKDDEAFGSDSEAISAVCEEPIREAVSIIYTTKPHCFSRLILPPDMIRPIALVSLPSLPRRSRLEDFWDSDHRKYYFVGDADPVDLLIFAWLRTFMSIEYLGVSDKLLNQHGNLGTARIEIALSESELSTIPHLAEWCPDYRALLGEHCASMLDGGFKIELEGAIAKFD